MGLAVLERPEIWLAVAEVGSVVLGLMPEVPVLFRGKNGTRLRSKIRSKKTT